MEHNSQATLAREAKSLIRESFVIPQGHDDDLLIEACEGFYVFLREVLPHAAGAILEPTPNNARRVQLHKSGYAYVAFQSARGAIEFLEAMQLDERCKPCTAEEWENGINEWQWQEYSHKIKLDIAATEESIAMLEGITDPTPNQLSWLEFEKEGLESQKEKLTKWENITEKGIRWIQLDIDEPDWPAETKRSILRALEDVVAKQPYMIDPDRRYTLFYQHGKLVGGTFKDASLGVHLSRQRQGGYYFVDPFWRIYRQCAVATMTTEDSGIYNPQARENQVSVRQLWDTGSQDPTIHRDHLRTLDPGRVLNYNVQTYVLANGTQRRMRVYRLEGRIEDEAQRPVTE